MNADWRVKHRAETHAGIRIGGERLATLDYASMFTRLAYASKGIEPPEGDLYAIPGLEPCRPAVKMGVNALLFDRHTRRRWPATEDTEQLLPAGWAMARFRRALFGLHPAITDCFGRGLGFELMHTESDIIVRVLTALSTEKVAALPLHDGILVRESDTDAAKTVMENSCRDVIRYVIPVTIIPPS